MVKTPVNVRSWKSTTIRVENPDRAEVSTAGWASAPKVVQSSPKAVHITRSGAVNLSNVNRLLRGQRDPIAAATAGKMECETA